jgi:hypothetical protein
MSPKTCPRCTQPVGEADRFCPSCGATLGATASPGQLLRYAPWLLTGVLGLVLVLLIARQRPMPATESPAPAAGTGAPPDISNLSPAERFDRLYQRIISAAQSGDQATVTQFMPMATAAFGMLDPVTVDARYHMAMLELHVGDMNAAQAQADTIKKGDSDHLFSYVITAAVARWKKDDKARDAAYREFMKRYDAQIATKKPEYLEHQSMLDEVKKAATGPKGSA